MLETQRLVMRRFREGDAELVVALDSDRDAVRYANPELIDDPPTLESVRKRTLPSMMEHNGRSDRVGFWAAFVKEDGEFAGWFMLEPREPGMLELGYRLMRPVWGRGLATEGGREMVARAFEHEGVERIAAVVHPENAPSMRVLEKLGFSREGLSDWYGDEPEPFFVRERPYPAWIARAYDTWNRGDLEAQLEYFTDDIRFITSGLFLDMAPVYSGREGVEQFWQDLRGAFEDLRIELVSGEEAQDRFFTRLVFHARGRDGIEATRRFGHVAYGRGGLIATLQTYPTWEEAEETFRSRRPEPGRSL
jgi:RimJ/RimL family protein N-acetyltransferase/ketosteroid isomerase-like protein